MHGLKNKQKHNEKKIWLCYEVRHYHKRSILSTLALILHSFMAVLHWCISAEVSRVTPVLHLCERRVRPILLNKVHLINVPSGTPKLTDSFNVLLMGDELMDSATVAVQSCIIIFFALAGDLIRNHRINNMEKTSDTSGMYLLKCAVRDLSQDTLDISEILLKRLIFFPFKNAGIIECMIKAQKRVYSSLYAHSSC